MFLLLLNVHYINYFAYYLTFGIKKKYSASLLNNRFLVQSKMLRMSETSM